jgi:hypothetical protein
LRLIFSALLIVVTFGLGSWGISFLLPSSPAWVKVAVSMVWLFVVVASAFFLGNQKRGTTDEERREFQHIVRNNILYLAIAILPITVLVALTIHDVDKGIQRNIKQNWLLCTITASAVLGLSIEEFWRLRRLWQMWAVLVAYSALHFSIGVPALFQLHRIRAGYISLIAMPELILVSYFLYLLQDKQTDGCR